MEHDILSHNWGPGGRAAIFFVSAFFILAKCIGDMGANIIPFGADSMTLFPRYVDPLLPGYLYLPQEHPLQRRRFPHFPRWLQHFPRSLLGNLRYGLLHCPEGQRVH